MDSQQPRRTSTAFEYFLYAAIVAETGLAALIYKVIFRSGELAHMRIYFAIFYFAFLAWTIAQLNMLHRDRTASVEHNSPATPLPQEQKRMEDSERPDPENATPTHPSAAWPHWPAVGNCGGGLRYGCSDV